MKNLQVFIFISLGIVFLHSCSSGQKLFQDNSGDWSSFGEASWKNENNELAGTVSNGKTGFVMTNDTFGNFLLELEFMPDNTINSGIFIRCNEKAINTTDCYEFNIWDTNPNQDYRTGAMVTKTKALAVVDTRNKWNTYKIRAEGEHIQVWVNGVLTTDTNDRMLSEGFIGLQALGNGTIKFRNISIKPL